MLANVCSLFFSDFQTKCSIFRGLLLCLCLSVTYANIVRFPRELEKYGCAFLVPYFVFIFLVGLPIILLEVSIGQFLGQGAGSSWRASPIMKGNNYIKLITYIWQPKYNVYKICSPSYKVYNLESFQTNSIIINSFELRNRNFWAVIRRSLKLTCFPVQFRHLINLFLIFQRALTQI